MKQSFYERIYALVHEIPKGKIATYGQLALLAGSPRASRIVGAAMAKAPAGRNLPCHRVIYTDGRLLPGGAFGGMEIQRQLLQKEGVTFLRDGRVDVKRNLWQPGSLVSAALEGTENMFPDA